MISTLRRPATGALLAALIASAGCQPSASSEPPTEAAAPAVTAESTRPARPDPAPVEDGPNAAGRASKADDASQAAGVAVKSAPRRRPLSRAERFAIKPSEDTAPIRPRLAIRAGGKRDITFDNVEFDIERDGDFDRSALTKEIEDLNGRTVVIRGFILASSVLQQNGIQQFVLVRDNQECCFGPGAYVFHNIRVDMAAGKTTSFRVRPVSVEGKFIIEPWIAVDGKCYSVYHMTAERVW